MKELEECSVQLGPAWDRSPSHVAGLDKDRSYWRRELENPPVLHLPTDFTRSSTPSERAGHVDIYLPENLVLCLRQVAGCEQSTFFSILLTAFTALLHRYTGQDDIVAKIAELAATMSLASKGLTHSVIPDNLLGVIKCQLFSLLLYRPLRQRENKKLIFIVASGHEREPHVFDASTYHYARKY